MIGQIVVFFPLLLTILFIIYLLYNKNKFSHIQNIPVAEELNPDEIREEIPQQHIPQPPQEQPQKQEPIQPKKVGKKKLASIQRKQNKKNHAAFLLEQREQQLLQQEEKEEQLLKRRRKRGINWVGLTKNTYSQLRTGLESVVRGFTREEEKKETEITVDLVDEIRDFVKLNRIVTLTSLSSTYCIPSEKIASILLSSSWSSSEIEHGKFIRNEDLIIYFGVSDLHEIHQYVQEKGRVDSEDLMNFVTSFVKGGTEDVDLESESDDALMRKDI